MAQFTERAIIESFVKLLNERPLDKITIKDIVEDCGINRNTFYYHFSDIPALVEKILESETQKAFAGETGMESWEESFITAAQFALQNKRVVYHIYNSVRREEVERYLNSIAGGVMQRYVENVSGSYRVKEEDKKLIADFYKSALVGMILDWLNGGMKYDPEQMIRRLGIMLKGNVAEAFERVQKS